MMEPVCLFAVPLFSFNVSAIAVVERRRRRQLFSRTNSELKTRLGGAGPAAGGEGVVGAAQGREKAKTFAHLLSLIINLVLFDALFISYTGLR